MSQINYLFNDKIVDKINRYSWLLYVSNREGIRIRIRIRTIRFVFVSGLKCGKRWHSDPISSVSDPNPSLISKVQEWTPHEVLWPHAEVPPALHLDRARSIHSAGAGSGIGEFRIQFCRVQLDWGRGQQVHPRAAVARLRPWLCLPATTYPTRWIRWGGTTGIHLRMRGTYRGGNNGS